MPRAICRCGHQLPIPAGPDDKVVCPNCGARVRVRRKLAKVAAGADEAGDGYIRFFCPCGRRLKVDASAPPPNGKCPDCGTIVPVPTASQAAVLPPGHPESPTDEIPTTDRDAIERWAESHRARRATSAPPAPAPPVASTFDPSLNPTMAFTLPPTDRVEVGMRICSECGQPLPLGATACRQCGAPAAKR